MHAGVEALFNDEFGLECRVDCEAKVKFMWRML